MSSGAAKKDGAVLPSAEVLTSGELMTRLGRKVEGVNLLDIEKYLKNSKIARKISGYCTQAMEKVAGQGKQGFLELQSYPNER